MRASRLVLPALAALTLSLAACAPPPIYKTGPDTVTASPQAVAHAPEQFQHREVIWGGRVVKVTNLATKTEIELLGYPLDRSQRPDVGAKPGGRFIAVVPGYLEPLNFPPGSLMTVAGPIKGMRSGNVGKSAYVFPLVEANEHHRWTAEEMRSPWSNVHFGVGIGTAF
ncbi:MAG TPA: Slp family lipoprotein [Rhodanobacteraceae bacterium]